MPDAASWIAATRTSHDRLRALLEPLSPDEATTQSYDTEWTVADVASHLGSQAEIFGLFLDAAFAGEPLPGGEAFGPIWDRWNALPPVEQISHSISANETFVGRLEGLTDAQRAVFPISAFGRELELPDLLAMRLGEHATHSWDIAVAFDPSAELPGDAVELLIDTVAPTAERTGKPVEGAEPVAIRTSDPTRHFTVTVSPQVSVAPAGAHEAPAVQLPAAAYIRLVFGRLDPEHTPSDVADDGELETLRAVFPGF